LLINSIMSIVLPTPVPPNSPIFPLRQQGAERSTIILVSKIDNFVSTRSVGKTKHTTNYNSYKLM
jgi:hypothetical protein